MNHHHHAKRNLRAYSNHRSPRSDCVLPEKGFVEQGPAQTSRSPISVFAIRMIFAWMHHGCRAAPLGLMTAMLNKLKPRPFLSANHITWFRLLIHIHILNDKQCRSRSVGFWRSQLIWIYTVCKGRVNPCSAVHGLMMVLHISLLRSGFVCKMASKYAKCTVLDLPMHP